MSILLFFQIVSFLDISEEEVIRLFRNCDKECREAVDRRAILWQKKLSENKSLMVDQLREMSKIMMELAKENRRCVPMSSRRFKQIAHAFKEMELQLKSLYLIENENGRTEISVTLKGKGKNPLSSDEVGDLLSVLLGTHLSSRQDNKFFLSEGFETLYYVEESRFHTLTGVAKAVKETAVSLWRHIPIRSAAW